MEKVKCDCCQKGTDNLEGWLLVAGIGMLELSFCSWKCLMEYALDQYYPTIGTLPLGAPLILTSTGTTNYIHFEKAE